MLKALDIEDDGQAIRSGQTMSDLQLPATTKSKKPHAKPHTKPRARPHARPHAKPHAKLHINRLKTAASQKKSQNAAVKHLLEAADKMSKYPGDKVSGIRKLVDEAEQSGPNTVKHLLNVAHDMTKDVGPHHSKA